MASRTPLLFGFALLCCTVLPMAWADDSPEGPLPCGTLAPDFAITTLEGSEIRLSTWRGHVVAINFFITWYRDAARHLSILEALSTKYSPQGLRLISISLDEGQGGPETTRAFIAATNIAHPVAADPQQQVAAAYGVRALPAIFIIGKDGKIQAYHEGYMEGDDEKIEGLISAALTAGAPAESQAETTGDEEPGSEEPVCHCFKQKSE